MIYWLLRRLMFYGLIADMLRQMFNMVWSKETEQHKANCSRKLKKIMLDYFEVLFKVSVSALLLLFHIYLRPFSSNLIVYSPLRDLYRPVCYVLLSICFNSFSNYWLFNARYSLKAASIRPSWVLFRALICATAPVLFRLSIYSVAESAMCVLFDQ